MINLALYKDAGFSTAQMRSLEELLEKEAPHWIVLNPSTGIYEMILDNQMLSAFRACPDHFKELYIHGYMPKGDSVRSWHLEFGIAFHKIMEEYYMQFRKPGFNVQSLMINGAISLWNDMNMDFFKEHKEYKSIGGVQGFCGMLLGYAMKFGPENERLRVIGTEIAFGKAKEVSLGVILNPHLTDPILECYLSGRIDTLVDDGTYICPMDHKTMASFRHDPAQRFEIDEGPTGYIYAVGQILPSFLASLNQGPLNRNTSKIIMNFISKSIPKEGERFKRFPIYKTQDQLESYRQRMLCTSEDIFRSLVNYAHTGFMWRDTSKCNNWYMHDCMYLPVHRQNSKTNELIVLNAHFEKKPIWDTEEV